MGTCKDEFLETPCGIVDPSIVIVFFPYNPPNPLPRQTPAPVPPRKAEFWSISAPFGSVSAPFGSVWLRLAPFWLRFGSVSGPFRVRFGVLGGVGVGSGWGRGEGLL